MAVVVAENQRAFTVEELKELVSLLEHQNTTDKYIDTELNINGNFAKLTVKIDGDGDIII